MKQSFFAILTIVFLHLPLLATAADYSPLVGIPGVKGSTDFDGYINSLYALSISIAALLAVIKIVIAGVKWMMTDIVTSKGEAKKDIEGALIGLLVVLAAVLILYVINPNLVKLDLTLAQPGNIIDNSKPAAPTFDSSKVAGYQVLGTTAEVYYLNSTDQKQIELFKQSADCKKDPNSNKNTLILPLSGGVRCIKHDPKEVVIPIVNATAVTQCTSPENLNGKYQEDSFLKKQNYGFCVYPKK
ncbi:MAG: hypothetical protein KBC35_00435 [Candidatus Pacebacteria bacterium]|jgi:hypothetical protein|nr:hypothetical protein [Candidatus Paceibacterota bacterium]